MTGFFTVDLFHEKVIRVCETTELEQNYSQILEFPQFLDKTARGFALFILAGRRFSPKR